MKLTKTTMLLTCSLCMTAISASAEAADAGKPETTVVLVHGAFADGSSWDKVIPILQAKGLKVIAVQNPLTSLADDVSAAQRVIDAQTGNVILVGHSWGGTVITQAGTSDKVKALVYVAALVPDMGQSSADLGKDYPPTAGIQTLKADAAGFLYLPADSLAKNFAQDLPNEMTTIMASTQGPIQGKAFAEPVTTAAWKDKKSYYIVAANDRMIQPALEHALARKIKATTTILQTSHVPMLSQPKQVADVILKAASAL